MPYKTIDIMNYLELKVILLIGFFTGYVPNYHMDYSRIITSVVGTILAGTIWIFIKPTIVRMRKKISEKFKNKQQ